MIAHEVEALSRTLEAAFEIVPPNVQLTRRSAMDAWAESGAMALTGTATGPPLGAPGAPATVLAAATSLLGAFVESDAAIPGAELLGERGAAMRLRRQGPISAGGNYRPIETRDGWMGLTLARPWDLQALPALVEGAVDDLWDSVAEWAANTTAEAGAARAQLLGVAASAITTHAGARPDAPFRAERHGRRSPSRMPVVIDLSALWAGPLCSNLLGLTGARVIKVESLSRPDAMRAGAPRFFDVLNSQSESVVLDLRTPAGIAALRALAQAADIVVESSRPRALAQLGIDAAEVASAGTTWVSITAYGRAGERSNCVGFGDDVAAAAGLVALEPETGAPLPCGDAIADPLAGAIAAVAALASVRAGGGHLIDVPMYDVSAWAATAQTDDTPAPRLAPKPRARTPSGHSTPLGHDTRRILDELLGKQ